MPQTNYYRHVRTGWVCVEHESPLPVAIINADLTFPLSDLNGLTIPLEVFQTQIRNNSREWVSFTPPIEVPEGGEGQ